MPRTLVYFLSEQEDGIRHAPFSFIVEFLVVARTVYYAVFRLSFHVHRCRSAAIQIQPFLGSEPYEHRSQFVKVYPQRIAFGTAVYRYQVNFVAVRSYGRTRMTQGIER